MEQQVLKDQQDHKVLQVRLPPQVQLVHRDQPVRKVQQE
jgi:hypothetical protein